MPLHLTPRSCSACPHGVVRSVDSGARQPTEVHRRVQLLSCCKSCSRHETSLLTDSKPIAQVPTTTYHRRAGPLSFVKHLSNHEPPFPRHQNPNHTSRGTIPLQRSVSPECRPSTIDKRFACLPAPGVGLLKPLTMLKRDAQREIYTGGRGGYSAVDERHSIDGLCTVVEEGDNSTRAVINRSLPTVVPTSQPRALECYAHATGPDKTAGQVALRGATHPHQPRGGSVYRAKNGEIRRILFPR